MVGLGAVGDAMTDTRPMTELEQRLFAEVTALRAEVERLNALIAAGHTHEWYSVTSKAEWRTTKVIHAACIDCVGDKANAKWPAEEKTR